jgi:hypothetical protein
MAASAFTGRAGRRRDLLKAVALAPVALVLRPEPASANDYASAGEALAAIDGLEAEVAFRLRALGAGVSSARAFTASLVRDLEAHGRARDQLRLRLGLGGRSPAKEAVEDALDLEGLRAVQEKLTYAHAEALPALADAQAVQLLAGHMVDLSRHLTLVVLWIEAEERRG